MREGSILETPKTSDGHERRGQELHRAKQPSGGNGYMDPGSEPTSHAQVMMTLVKQRLTPSIYLSYLNMRVSKVDEKENALIYCRYTLLISMFPPSQKSSGGDPGRQGSPTQ